MSIGYETIKGFTQGERLGSYLPIAGWYHFPLQDDDIDKFVPRTIESTDANGWDFVKIMTNGNYLPIAYGADYEYSRDPHKWDGVFHSHPITNAADAAALPVLGLDNAVLSNEVEVAKRLVARYKGDKPVIATLFDPLSWVQELSTPLQPQFTLDLLHNDPESLEHALRSIQQTNLAFVDALIEQSGIDGVFFSTKFSSSKLLTPEEHRRFVLPYVQEFDEHIAGRTWFNVLHVHGEQGLYFDDLPSLGFQAVNWESAGRAEGLTSIASLRERTDKVLVAGFDRFHDFDGTREEAKARLAERLDQALAENEGGPLVFAPGCTISLDADESYFTLVAEVAAEKGLRG